ncbi:hypothetical protein PUNSTDRAFT_131635 [Punctularia strigosozonata HHB-11173 SS5]|uniref:uncharacterized protein n=1 Tax=Punctularia strigosozonata (strain HHB-11173) TaxID=741275 RepID=UPI0004418108|nr:uncharacterized protein PUNSTDRAFT_131635 [Punctularia strigosozonata HHB-11173 SS5]EIN11467.1 hypothetical protein PUNSTDRAFT_131635 [Punctularia strigosozonata HHB-11173 SS5]
MPRHANVSYGSVVGLRLPIDQFRGYSSNIQRQLQKANAYVESADVLRDRRVPSSRQYHLQVLRQEAVRRLKIVRASSCVCPEDVDLYKNLAKSYFIAAFDAAVQDSTPHPPLLLRTRAEQDSSPSFPWWPQVHPAPAFGWALTPSAVPVWGWTPPATKPAFGMFAPPTGARHLGRFT